MLIYALALWGIGLGVGYLVAFGQWPTGDPLGMLDALGARGFWYAQTAGNIAAATALFWEYGRVSRRTAAAAAPL